MRENQTIYETIDRWNKLYPVGTMVDVRRDNGQVLRTKTRSEAWIVACNQTVVMVEGIVGCYSLDRVTPLT